MSNKPVHEIRIGRVRAAVWASEAAGVTRYNATFSRLYKDEVGQWKDSTSFGREDLPLVMKVADLAHTWMYQQGQEPQARTAETGD
jgi:hypothetical protein